MPLPLPVRIAHPSHPQLSYFTDEYFEMLVRCGYGALALDSSPFDSDTGRVSQFFKGWHLISFYDIAYSEERERYRDYYHEVHRRAHAHGIRLYMQTYEPRLPYYAWSATPPHWRGHGGWVHNGNDAIAFCWSEPDAVDYWKQMARDALAALPEISGISISFMDNEAVPCDERCPKCRDQKVTQMMRDVLETYAEIGAARGDFPIHIIDWMMDEEQIAQMREVVGSNGFIIGHSCKDLTQEIDGELVPGAIADMTTLSGRCHESFIAKRAQFTALGFRFIDRIPWSHAGENWYLPAPPDPAFAIEKLNALQATGAEGWCDYDCGALEPGSIADAIAAWTRRPDAAPEELIAEVLRDIFSLQCQEVLPAYQLFSKGKNYFPAAYNSTDMTAFSARCMALDLTVAGPFFLEDFVYFDTLHAFNFFAPFNLVTPDTIGYVTPRVARAAQLTGEAFAAIEQLKVMSPSALRERDAFEIHYRQYRSIANYFHLAQAKLAWLNRQSEDGIFEARVQSIAQNEWENHISIESWTKRNPGELHNAIFNIVGILEECWPGVDFKKDMLGPKRRSLKKLLRYKVAPPLPRGKRL